MSFADCKTSMSTSSAYCHSINFFGKDFCSTSSTWRNRHFRTWIWPIPQFRLLYCRSYYTVVPPPPIHDIVPVARFSLGSYFEKKLQFWGKRDTAPKSEVGYLIGRPVNPEKSCHGNRLCESCMELPCYLDCRFQDIAECSCAGGETHTLAS